MNAQLLDQARAAYRAGDFSAAAQMFSAAKSADEVFGEADHLRGNSLMRLGMFSDAASAYSAALNDAAYGKRGALLTNRGKALSAAGDFAGAANSFTEAVTDSSYATPYKAYMGLGNALLKLDNPTDAGVAFRSAAIDAANPAPAAALSSLGDCFLLIGRPEDAAESYRTALDFVGPKDDPRAINASLGTAYAAANRPSDAIDAFQRATADGIYQLTADQQTALSGAQDTLSAQRSMSTEVSSTGAFQAGVDPLDPLGQSGSFIPDPSDTGFFTLSESEMIQQDKKEMKVRRRHRHTGLKVFLVIVLLLLLAAGGLAFAYTRGYGYPTQQDVLTGLFDAVTNGTETDSFLASGLNEDSKAIIAASIPDGATPTIEGLDRSMTESTAAVSVELSKGGTAQYEVTFVREGLGWAVANVALDFDSISDDSAADASDEPASSDEGSEAQAEDASTSDADGSNQRDSDVNADEGSAE